MADVQDIIGSRVLGMLEAYFPALTALNEWTFFIIILFAAIALSQIAAWVFGVFLKGLTSKTKSEADDILIHAIQQPIAWLIFSVLLYVAVAPLTLQETVKALVNSVIVTLNLLIVAWLLHRLVSAIMDIWKEFAKKTESELDDAILPIISKFAKAAIWIVALLLILESFGVQIGPFLAGLGIAGVAIGFAVKDSLANIFGGISLAFDKAYRVGDKIRIQDGTVGIVHDITLRSTRLRTFSGDLLMVPNGKVANENIYTYAQPAPKSRGEVKFGVEYGTKAEKVRKVILEALKPIEKIADDPAVGVHFLGMGDSSLNFVAYFWLNDYSEVWGTEREATEAIYNALNKARIGIPFPTRTVYMKK